MNFNEKLEGIISVCVCDKQGNPKYKNHFKNLITDLGMDAAVSQGLVLLAQYCGFGTGSQTPTVSDTSLAAPFGDRLAYSSTSTGNSSGSPVWYSYCRTNYIFPAGSVTGTLAEIGFFSAPTGGTMWSRSLVKDSNGNPTTVTVLSDEIVYVTYEVRKYSPSSDVTGTFSLSVNGTPTDFTYTVRASRVNTTQTSGEYWYGCAALGGEGSVLAYETDALGSVTNYPSGSAVSGTATESSYVAGSFTQEIQCIFDPAVANFNTGIGSLEVDKGFQISFSPKLPKNSDRRLVLPVNITWSRA